jgi:two-component system, LuxR family, response regulator FixJ
VSDKQTVHVIDDDPAIRASTALFLTAMGFEVQTYDSAHGFLEAAGPRPTGCVVTDVRMPGISGIELIARMEERGLALPIIVITAYADIALAVTAMKQGAADLLEKPFNNVALVASIRQALARGNEDSRISPEDEAVRARFSTLTNRESEVLEIGRAHV